MSAFNPNPSAGSRAASNACNRHAASSSPASSASNAAYGADTSSAASDGTKATSDRPKGMSNAPTGAKLGVFTLAIMNVVAVVSLRALPAEVAYGMSSAFYYLLAAIIFLIPVSLVAAELAALFPDKQGGIFRWVGEAFGDRLGFLCIWLQWLQTAIWFPTVLTFAAVSLAFIGPDASASVAFASNRFYTLAVVLVIYWSATAISLRGLEWVGRVSKIGGIVGTIVPALLLIAFAAVYLLTGGHPQMDLGGRFIPDMTKFGNLVLAASIFLFYAGMEMSGLHVRQVRNAKVNYPRAVLIGAVLTVLIFMLGTFALAIVIPAHEVNLVESLLVGFDRYTAYMHVPWLSSIIALAITFGVLAAVLTWVSGPSKGILEVGRAGYLPPFFHKMNKRGVQRNILLLQGAAVTVLSLLFVVMPTVQSFYQILTQLTAMLYVTLYLLMFPAAIRLRYLLPRAERPFRIGREGSNWLLWVVCGVGFLASLLAFVMSIFPPTQIETGSPLTWYAVMAGGCLVFMGSAFVVYALRRPSWVAPDSDFESFHWE